MGVVLFQDGGGAEDGGTFTGVALLELGGVGVVGGKTSTGVSPLGGSALAFELHVLAP